MFKKGANGLVLLQTRQYSCKQDTFLQEYGKTESERDQRLLEMTIWMGYVGSTLINVYGFERGPRRTRG